VPYNAYILTLTRQQQWGLVLGVLVFVAIFGGFIYLSKRLQRGAAASGRRIKILDRAMLTRDSAVMLIQVGTRLMAVGVGKGTPSILCELSHSDFAEPENKPEAGRSDSGFLERFMRSMKSGVTGGGAAQSHQDASFSDLLRQLAENDPVSGAENAGDAGYPYLPDEERRPANRFKRNYQRSIDNMNRLSEPDRLDRRSRYYGDGRVRPAESGTPPMTPPAPPPRPVVSEEERAERIDNVLDLIAQRQSRTDERNDAGGGR
jgi:flagellar biogenesis protein FliO